LLSQRLDGRRVAREKYLRRQGDQLCRIGLIKGRIACGKAVVDLDILALDPTQLLQRTREDLCTCPSHRVLLGPRDQPADAANSLGLLRVPGKRPCCRSGEDGHEPAPLQ